ncbi:MAG: hypothetical protein ABIQ93_15060 [Saprospiraceae bacterium]
MVYKRRNGILVFQKQAAPGKLSAQGMVEYYPEPEEKPAVSDKLVATVVEYTAG